MSINWNEIYRGFATQAQAEIDRRYASELEASKMGEKKAITAVRSETKRCINSLAKRLFGCTGLSWPAEVRDSERARGEIAQIEAEIAAVKASCRQDDEKLAELNQNYRGLYAGTPEAKAHFTKLWGNDYKQQKAKVIAECKAVEGRLQPKVLKIENLELRAAELRASLERMLPVVRKSEQDHEIYQRESQELRKNETRQIEQIKQEFADRNSHLKDQIVPDVDKTFAAKRMDIKRVEDQLNLMEKLFYSETPDIEKRKLIEEKTLPFDSNFLDETDKDGLYQTPSQRKLEIVDPNGKVVEAREFDFEDKWEVLVPRKIDQDFLKAVTIEIPAKIRDAVFGSCWFEGMYQVRRQISAAVELHQKRYKRIKEVKAYHEMLPRVQKAQEVYQAHQLEMKRAYLDIELDQLHNLCKSNGLRTWFDHFDEYSHRNARSIPSDFRNARIRGAPLKNQHFLYILFKFMGKVPSCLVNRAYRDLTNTRLERNQDAIMPKWEDYEGAFDLIEAAIERGDFYCDDDYSIAIEIIPKEVNKKFFRRKLDALCNESFNQALAVQRETDNRRRELESREFEIEREMIRQQAENQKIIEEQRRKNEQTYMNFC